MHCRITDLQWVILHNSILSTAPLFLNALQAIKISNAIFEIDDRLRG